MRSAEGQTTKGSLIYDRLVLKPEIINVYYFITAKHTARWPTEKQYRQYMDFIEKRGLDIQQVGWEKDSLGKLHIHCVAVGRTNILVKRLRKKHMHLDIQEIGTNEDLERVVRYLEKESQNKYPEHLREYLDDYHHYIQTYPFI